MKKWRLLVVDDEPLNLEIIAEFLDEAHFDLDLTLNAERALEKLEAPDAKYDLIVLDRMMPGMSGIEFLRLIKGERRFQRIPVIMQTAASAPEQVREGIEAGAYYYLTKPYEPKALLAIIRAALADMEDQAKQAVTVEQMQHQSDALRLVSHAEFRFATLAEARALAALLAALCPAPDMAAMGLSELLVNAVEHGNLGISYAEKSHLNREGGWADEIARRLTQPEYQGRFATVCIERDPGKIIFYISDQGAGFDWRNYLEMDPARAFDPNGRGIAMARQISFNSLKYLGCGNKAVATIDLPLSPPVGGTH
ncbi:MAG: response regulator [Betaproteobacteria bacterium]|nr:response regulator [Betaproteobacteria bacterium]